MAASPPSSLLLYPALRHEDDGAVHYEDVDLNFIGSGWDFVRDKRGNFWFHAKTGKKLMSSSTWEPSGIKKPTASVNEPTKLSAAPVSGER